ncbi:hypothetical protein [Aquibacillus rhizosphaerae]|uniref:DUF3953 domain-containing protein n=1 Tax=Aquibacillus rhizosphaerae TaxID=3051431 RepID=A0ABT7L3E0_9BACI|nr:hypothetical protein [Aquibacillus sp. LR5S19]MDL4839884.1 hypothetical protein [Aquibacillus sp. LR5S19]
MKILNKGINSFGIISLIATICYFFVDGTKLPIYGILLFSSVTLSLVGIEKVLDDRKNWKGYLYIVTAIIVSLNILIFIE